MRQCETRQREKRRSREQRQAKTNLRIVYYDSTESETGYVKAGPYSAGDSIHKQLMIELDRGVSWSAFGGYFNGLPEFSKKLKEADVLIVKYDELPDDEPSPGSGIKSLMHHIEASKNNRLKIYTVGPSLIKIKGAKSIQTILDIIHQ
ncbi:hypothetical protein CVU83_02050 [Candidatus Falkowbacteria bacterium HGW-Falkowbacteria-2]|jgi:hypothetical protein|uniref:Uncharacterized protein n=1 Tax=Candidatus Falkowbacteria bacterium HGW-Falkowbacteria-2 TaxID=2013769 RepID=A0A2N2E0E4_9BACT|nr:MAG: hypothetical protein CVU83_02050 [Candidatus Falkowbacteria bacterium HGW-Falkowbacteria-2]